MRRILYFGSKLPTCLPPRLHQSGVSGHSQIKVPTQLHGIISIVYHWIAQVTIRGRVLGHEA